MTYGSQYYELQKKKLVSSTDFKKIFIELDFLHHHASKRDAKWMYSSTEVGSRI